MEWKGRGLIAGRGEGWRRDGGNRMERNEMGREFSRARERRFFWGGVFSTKSGGALIGWLDMSQAVLCTWEERGIGSKQVLHTYFGTQMGVCVGEN